MVYVCTVAKVPVLIVKIAVNIIKIVMKATQAPLQFEATNVRKLNKRGAERLGAIKLNKTTR